MSDDSQNSIPAQNITETIETVNQLKSDFEAAKEDLVKFKSEIKKTGKDLKKETNSAMRLTVFGFWLILIMTVGVFVGYWIVAVNRADLLKDLESAKSDIQKIIDVQNETIYKQGQEINRYSLEINNLKNQLNNFKILNPYLK